MTSVEAMASEPQRVCKLEASEVKENTPDSSLPEMTCKDALYLYSVGLTGWLNW